MSMTAQRAGGPISPIALAAARLGWSLGDVEILEQRPVEEINRWLHHGTRLLLTGDRPDLAGSVATLVRAGGFGASSLIVFEGLGGPNERIHPLTTDYDGTHSVPAVVAVHLRGAGRPSTALPDESIEGDATMTRRELRAVALAELAPQPGQLLWDVGAGSGAVAIEWMRVHPSCRAVAIEPRADRRARMERNAVAFGVPTLQVVKRSAPAAFGGLPAPDAIFLGGGLTVDSVLDRCLMALTPGGRLVVHAATIETETILAAQHAALGGELIRLALARAESLGGFDTFRPALSVTQWAYTAPPA